MQDGIVAPVIGPSTILPRGYLWLAPIWYAAITAVLALSRPLPVWFRLTAAAGMFGAFLTFVLVLSTITIKALAVDREGVRLGLPSGTRRRGRRRRQVRHLTWGQIERVRIARRPYGIRLEFLLSPESPLSTWPRGTSRLVRAVSWLLMLLFPFGYLWRRTGLASPLDHPPRYRVPVRHLNADHARSVLRSLAPSDVAIAVLIRKR